LAAVEVSVSRTVFFVTAFLLCLEHSSAFAQRRWDIAAFGGLVTAHAPVERQADDYRQDWFQTGHAGVTIGRHLTSHLKVEADLAATGTGTQFVQRFVTVPGRTTPYLVGAEAETSLRWAGAEATWQFFDNEWVHPFVFAGLSAQFDRRSVHVWEQYFYAGDARVPGNQFLLVPESREGPTTTTSVSGVFGGGAKLYVTDRAFFRADARFGASPRTRSVSFRAGLGVDF
jgi:hypothetical protein